MTEPRTSTLLADPAPAATRRRPSRPPASRTTARPTRQTRPTWVGWVLTAALTALPAAVAVTLSLVGAAGRELWNDEYATWYAATLSASDLSRLLHHIDMVIAPYYLFMHAWIGAFGDSALSLRMPSALAMGGAAAATALLGRRLFGPWAGLTAGLLLAVVPAVSRYGQEARPYGFAVLSAALSTLLLLRAVDRPTWSRWLWYGGLVTVGGWTHIVTVTIVVTHAVVVWRSARERDDLRIWRWFGALAVPATLLLPTLSEGSKQSSAIDWIKADGHAVAVMPSKLFGSGPVAAAVVALALLGCLVMPRPERRRALPLLATWAVFAPVFCYVTFPLLHLFLYRYLLFTMPAWALLAAATLTGAARMAVRSGGAAGPRLGAAVQALAAAVLLPGLLWLGLPGQHDARRSPVLGEPDFRAVAGLIAARLQEHDGIAYGGEFRNGRRAMAYELRGRPHPRDVFLERTAQEVGGFGAQECREPVLCLADTRRIWLVTTTTTTDPLGQLAPVTRDVLRQEFQPGEVRQFSGVRVVLLRRTGADFARR